RVVGKVVDQGYPVPRVDVGRHALDDARQALARLEPHLPYRVVAQPLVDGVLPGRAQWWAVGCAAGRPTSLSTTSSVDSILASSPIVTALSWPGRQTCTTPPACLRRASRPPF